MESVVGVIKYLFYGFLALIAVLVVVAVVFGKRVIRKWEYEAEFRDASGRELGELELKMSRIEKEEPDFSLKVDFWLRHESLLPQQTVRVYLDEIPLLEGMVGESGRIRLGNQHLQTEIDEPVAGAMCRVECGGQEIAGAELLPD